MQNLLPLLRDYDPDVLAIVAHRWDVDIEADDPSTTAQALAAAMLDPIRASAEWARLSDKERGALQMLLAAREGRMPEAQFSRLFGEIRQMGPARREREKPHLSPANVAEALYYRGLLGLGFAQAKAGVQTLFVFVPSDLAAVLPAHETGFDLDSESKAGPPAARAISDVEPAQLRTATTALVDDLTTLLAFLQVTDTAVDVLHERVSEALAADWLGPAQPARVALLIALVGGMKLASVDSGMFKLVPATTRRWLEQTRPQQVRALAEAWRDSAVYNDLWHLPGLVFEDTGWRNDPLLARQTVLTYLEMVPPDDWWPLDELIAVVKEEEPDFQRPGGDYESWYIRDAASDGYLRGFQQWDQVDGAVLRFILTGPLHWLGLLDLGDNESLGRLTAYGRSLCGFEDWPNPPEEPVNLVVENDGTIRAPRTANRFERFQAARFTEWGAAGDPYTYRLTVRGLERAAAQGIQIEPIRAFLRRASGAELPGPVEQLLAQWEQVGGASLWMERAVVLRAESPDALQTILDTPELRRYLGATLGPTAVVVRAGQEYDLAAALQQRGILAGLDDHNTD